MEVKMLCYICGKKTIHKEKADVLCDECREDIRNWKKRLFWNRLKNLL